MAREVIYLREQARLLREMAAGQPDPVLKSELIELAERCEKLANHMDGNGHAKD
jgi:hypothetical protein